MPVELRDAINTGVTSSTSSAGGSASRARYVGSLSGAADLATSRACASAPRASASVTSGGTRTQSSPSMSAYGLPFFASFASELEPHRQDLDSAFVSGSGSRMGAAEGRQVRLDAVIVTAAMPLACGNVVELWLRRPERSVRDRAHRIHAHLTEFRSSWPGGRRFGAPYTRRLLCLLSYTAGDSVHRGLTGP
jgi:hypothetical protein